MAQDFHNLCNGKGNLLILAKSTNGKVFGGFHTVPHNSNANDCIADPTAFIFSVSNCTKFPIKNGR